METLNILLTSNYYPPYFFGGDAMHVYYLANALAKEGHEVNIITGLYKHHSNDIVKEYKHPNHKNVRIHALRVPFEIFSRVSLTLFGSDYFLSKKISSIINSVKPDVLHHHNMGGLGISALDMDSPCTLYTAHDYWLICPRSDLMFNGRTLCDGKSSCFTCAIKLKHPRQLWRYIYYHRLIKEKVNNKVDRIITPSDYMRNMLFYNGVPSKKMKTIYNFVHEPPNTAERIYDFPYFLYVGVLTYLKGVENLIHAYLKICDKTNTHLLIVGEGPLKRHLQKLIMNSSKLGKIHLIGKKGHDILPHLYKNAVATIIPSIWPENFPLVALESLSCGTPVIAAKVGGLPEIVNVLKTGVMFERNSIVDLSKNMLLLDKDDSLRNTLKKNAYSAYVNYFSPEVYLKNYMALIKDVRGDYSYSCKLP